MNRRKLLLGGGAILAAGVGTLAWSRSSTVDLSDIASRPRLAMPPLLDTTQSGRFELIAQSGSTKFIGDTASPTLGFNQPYLGPVIRMKAGEVAARVENRLDRVISSHWHGMVLPGEFDGGPHQAIAPGSVWEPVLPVTQSPLTAWFHTHIHGETASSVYAGLAGGIIVSDGRDEQRGLPSTYGEDDLYLVLQDKQFSSDGQLIYGADMMSRMHGFTGDTMLVNGQPGAVAKVPKGLVRLRLLNASNARIFRLQFSDGRPMHLIATDSGYIPIPLGIDSLRLAPGERAEVVVDFSSGNAVALTSQRDPNAGMGGMMGRFQQLGADLVGGEFEVLAFAVDDREKTVITKIPDALGGKKPALTDTNIAATRRFALEMGMGGGMMGEGMMGGGMMGSMSINGQPYDMERIDFEPKRGTVERWIIQSSMLAHPFHIHGVDFQVVKENGGPPRPENSGMKDTVLVENETEILVRFNQPAGADRPFMYHCHILEHEDAGMMGQFSVT